MPLRKINPCVNVRLPRLPVAVESRRACCRPNGAPLGARNVAIGRPAHNPPLCRASPPHGQVAFGRVALSSDQAGVLSAAGREACAPNALDRSVHELQLLNRLSSASTLRDFRARRPTRRSSRFGRAASAPTQSHTHLASQRSKGLHQRCLACPALMISACGAPTAPSRTLSSACRRLA